MCADRRLLRAVIQALASASSIRPSAPFGRHAPADLRGRRPDTRQHSPDRRGPHVFAGIADSPAAALRRAHEVYDAALASRSWTTAGPSTSPLRSAPRLRTRWARVGVRHAVAVRRVVGGFLRADDGLVGNQAGLSDAGTQAAAFRADDLGTQSEVGASLGKRCGVRQFGEDTVGLGEQPKSPRGPRRPRSPETVTRPGKITNWDWSVSRKRHRPKIS